MLMNVNELSDAGPYKLRVPLTVHGGDHYMNDAVRGFTAAE